MYIIEALNLEVASRFFLKCLDSSWKKTNNNHTKFLILLEILQMESTFFFINAYMVVFLFNTALYVFLLLCLCILIVCLCIFIVPAGNLRLPCLRFFPVLLPQLYGKCQGKTRKDGARPALFQNFCVVLCIVCFVSFCVLCVCKCVLYYCHRVATQLR